MSTLSTYIGDGATTQYDITFSYDDASTVKATVNGVEVPFTFVNSSRIAFDTAPASGAEIRIFRQTDVSTPAVDFTDGAIIRASDLDAATGQARDRAEEIGSLFDDLYSRALKAPPGETGYSFPSKTSLRGKFLAGDATGDLVPSSGTGADAGLRTDLATNGFPLLSLQQPFPGAVGRPADEWAAEHRSVGDFSADRSGATDNTGPFNAATQATADYSSLLRSAIGVPSGQYKLGATDASVYVRLDQRFSGEGWNTRIDLSANSANVNPAFVLGKKSDGTDDPAGPPVEMSDLFILGGSGTAPNIKTAAAGYKLSDLFMSAPGIGIEMGGSDGLLSKSIFDVGLNHLWISGFNLLINQALFFEGNYQVTVKSGAVDVTISGSQFEYFAYNAILFDTGATGIKNIRVVNSTFLQNSQPTTSEGAISMRASAAELAVVSSVFRNLYGAGLVMVDAGSEAVVQSSSFNGLKTQPTYTQSTTMKGIDVQGGASLVVTSSDFANLPGQPIEIGGSSAITVLIIGSTFRNNSGGAADILVSNTNPASKVYIIGCKSDRTLVSVTGAAAVETMFSADPDTGWTAGLGSTSRGAFVSFNTFTADAAYNQTQIQTLSDNLSAASWRLLALEQAVRKGGLIDG